MFENFKTLIILFIFFCVQSYGRESQNNPVFDKPIKGIILIHQYRAPASGLKVTVARLTLPQRPMPDSKQSAFLCRITTGFAGIQDNLKAMKYNAAVQAARDEDPGRPVLTGSPGYNDSEVQWTSVLSSFLAQKNRLSFIDKVELTRQ